MQRENGTPAACASCRHQRKKCTANCVLAPYFPVEKNKEFQTVHKLFGVSNIIKLVNSLDVADRKRAIDSLVWEATCRQNDPVVGSYGEFNRVVEELKWYKTQFGTSNFQQADELGIRYLDNKGVNRNALIPDSYPGFVNYPSIQPITAIKLREEFSCKYPSVQNVENLEEESNNNCSVIFPQQQYGVVENLNLKEDLGQKYALAGFNQNYYELQGQYRPSGDAKP